MIDPAWGWRIAFFVGGGIGLVILLLRTWIPESPRWLATHGYVAEADRVVTSIEKRFIDEGITLPPVDESKRMKLEDAQPHAAQGSLRHHAGRLPQCRPWWASP